MTHALNNASHTSVCAELGISVGSDRQQRDLTRHASINKWSFYRPGSIAPNASDYVTLTAPSNNDKLGDFRGYNHNANEPYPFDVYPTGKDWGPGGSTISLIFQVYVEEANYRELYGGSQPYITIRYYMSSANRDAQTSYVRTYTVSLSETSNSPPTGHTNNQTQKPASASQLITDSAFPTSYLATPDDTIYCDLYFSDISGNQVVRFGSTLADGHVDIDTHEYQQPYIAARGIPDLSPPTGYSQFEVCCTGTSSTACSSSVHNVTQGTDDLTFYHSQRGFRSSSPYEYRRVASTGTTVRLKITNSRITTGYPVYITILSSGSYSNLGNKYFSTTALGHTWQYDDIATLEIVTNGTIGAEGASACAP
jgi:hypothetical protein